MHHEVLAIGAHPDDLELGIGGTIALLVEQGHSVAMLDLTRARLSTRGTPENRAVEAENAARVLGVKTRLNLDVDEGSIDSNPNNIQKLVSVIRQVSPLLILAPYWEDRHPDHAASSRLVHDAVFWSGVVKYGDQHPPTRPSRVAYYFAHWESTPTFVVDVSTTFERKMTAGREYHSQFDLAPGEEPPTYISRPDFFDRVRARGAYWGSRIGVQYGEAFLVREMTRVSDILEWTSNQGVVG